MRYFVYFFLLAMLMWHLADRDHVGMYLKWYVPTSLRALAPNQPIQTAVQPGDVASWVYNRCTFTPLAHYDITARLLHRYIYPPGADVFAQVCPIDYTLGWGRMSNPLVYDRLDIGQIARHSSYDLPWYDVTGSCPIPPDEINVSFSNNHLIPANGTIKEQLFNFAPGDVIRLVGYLVEIDAPEWVVKSSLTRTDQGDGACEVMWVQQATKVGR